MAAGIGLIAGLAQGVLGFAQAQYQGQVARNNEIIAQRNAWAAIHRSEIEQQDQDAQTSGMIGELVAEQGASGVAINSGSAVLTRSAVAKLGRQDALRVRYGGEMEAFNYKTQAANFHAQQDASKFEGIASLAGGFLGGISSLVGSSTSVNRKKYGFAT